jgi:hypothetical protein
VAPPAPRPRLTERRRVALALALTAAVCLPVYWSGWEPTALEPVARAQAILVENALILLGVEVERSGIVLRSSSEFALEIGIHCTAWIYLVAWVVGHLARDRARGIVGGSVAILGLNELRLILLYAGGATAPSAFRSMHEVSEAVLVVAYLFLWFLSTPVAQSSSEPVRFRSLLRTIP